MKNIEYIKPHYPNLEAELARAGIGKKELAEALEINRSTLYRKLCGKSDFTGKELLIIYSVIFKEKFSLEYLLTGEH